MHRGIRGPRQDDCVWGAGVNESLRSNFKFDRTRCFGGQSPLPEIAAGYPPARSLSDVFLEGDW